MTESERQAGSGSCGVEAKKILSRNRSPTANNARHGRGNADALGSARIVTSTTGTVVFSDNYQPFGQDNSASGSETYRFTGKP